LKPREFEPHDLGELPVTSGAEELISYYPSLYNPNTTDTVSLSRHRILLVQRLAEVLVTGELGTFQTVRNPIYKFPPFSEHVRTPAVALHRVTPYACNGAIIENSAITFKLIIKSCAINFRACRRLASTLRRWRHT